MTTRWLAPTVALLVWTTATSTLAADRKGTQGVGCDGRVTSSSSAAQQVYEDGIRAFFAGDHELARVLLQKTLAVDPSFAQAHRNLGVLFSRMHNAEASHHHYRMYLQIAPCAPDADRVQDVVADYVARGISPKAPDTAKLDEDVAKADKTTAVAVGTRPSADVWLDGEPQTRPTPLMGNHRLRLDRGEHWIGLRSRSDGRAIDIRVRVGVASDKNKLIVGSDGTPIAKGNVQILKVVKHPKAVLKAPTP